MWFPKVFERREKKIVFCDTFEALLLCGKKGTKDDGKDEEREREG